MSAAMGELHGQADGSIVPPRPMSQTFVPCINVTGPVSVSLASVVPPFPLTLALMPPTTERLLFPGGCSYSTACVT